MDNVFKDINSIIDTKEITSKEDFDAFIDNLINHPAPLREAVAYRLEELFCEKYLDDKTLEIILKAIIDINPNVSRCVCSLIEKSNKLQEALKNKIINNINELLTTIPDCEKKDNKKNHKKNKMLFSLYWLLEALSCCICENESGEIIEILQKTINFCDYTIREKTAKITAKLSNPPKNLLDLIDNDENFYVNFYTKLYKK